MFSVDNVKNTKYIKLLKKTLNILKQHGVKNVFLIGSVAVSGHLGFAYKTFNDIEAIVKPHDLSKIVKILKKSNYEVLENTPDRTAFLFDGTWIGFIDRSNKFKTVGLDPKGAYQNSKKAILYGVKFDVLNKDYLIALYKMAVIKSKFKKDQYKHAIKLLT